jgi:hypothetical protein
MAPRASKATAARRAWASSIFTSVKMPTRLSSGNALNQITKKPQPPQAFHPVRCEALPNRGNYSRVTHRARALFIPQRSATSTSEDSAKA